jgi:predicted ribosome quality control (RQC) complex YloA/Tae2 family protein
MTFRRKKLKSGEEILLGKDAKSNDELMKKFEGKENVIFHTVAPGSPFCVIDTLHPRIGDISASGAICASYSQDWRDHHSDVMMNKFTGKDISKDKKMKAGTWKVNKAKKIKIRKRKIENVNK